MALRKMNAALQTGLATGKMAELTKRLSIADFNRVVFHTEAEEQDDGLGGGVYHIDGIPDMPYCGLHCMYTLYNVKTEYQPHVFVGILRLTPLSISNTTGKDSNTQRPRPSIV